MKDILYTIIAIAPLLFMGFLVYIDAWAEKRKQSETEGCICPATSENTCRNPNCPRKA